MDQEIMLIDNSTIKSYKRCFYYGYFRHDLDWTSDATLAMNTGSAIHSGCDAIWAHCKDGISPRDLAEIGIQAMLIKWEELGYSTKLTPAEEEEMSPRTPGIIAEILLNYVNVRWDFLQRIQVLEIEQPFIVPLDPSDPNLFYVGRPDKVYEDHGSIYVLDHKSTSLYSIKEGIQRRWINQWCPDAQIDGYIHALHMKYGNKARGAYIDGLLVHKKHHDIFQFVPILRDEEHISSWLSDTLYWVNEIKKARGTGIYPRNTEGCMDQYGNLCTYRDACIGYGRVTKETLPPSHLRIEKWEPYDLDEIRQAIAKQGV